MATRTAGVAGSGSILVLAYVSGWYLVVLAYA